MISLLKFHLTSNIVLSRAAVLVAKVGSTINPREMPTPPPLPAELPQTQIALRIPKPVSNAMQTLLLIPILPSSRYHENCAYVSPTLVATRARKPVHGHASASSVNVWNGGRLALKAKETYGIHIDHASLCYKKETLVVRRPS